MKTLFWTAVFLLDGEADRPSWIGCLLVGLLVVAVLVFALGRLP